MHAKPDLRVEYEHSGHFFRLGDLRRYPAWSKQQMDFGILFFGILFPAISLAGAHLLRKSWRLGSASQNWPTTRGRIVESRFEPNDDSYDLTIKYEYAVDGEELEGDVYSYRGFSTSLTSVEYIVAQYPVGADVRVFFDPTNAKSSVLKPGVDRNAYLTGGIVLLLLFSVGVCCFGYAIWSFVMAG